MLKNYILGITFLLINSQFLFSQEKLSENQKLEQLCKIWGFLKYYHPQVTTGAFDWDAQLISKIQESEKIDTKKQFNALLSTWIDQLGEVKKCKTCKENSDKKYFLKNFDLSWTDDKNTFSTDVINKLNYIENNRNQAENHYYIFDNKLEKIGIQNEKYTTDLYPSKELRLVELFRYWNLIEYFFPYKYQTDQKWNSVLSEMIPKFINASNEKDYALATLELLAKTDDSHVVLKSSDLVKYLFGKRTLSIEVISAENKLVVSKVLDRKSGGDYALQADDVILEINGESIPDLVKKYSKYTSASNTWGKLRSIKNLVLWSNNPSLNLKIERKGIVQNIDAKTYVISDIIYYKKNEGEKWRFLDEAQKIGYVNIGAVEVADVEDIFKSLKDTKAIVFDVRNYPKGTIRAIAAQLLPEVTQYYTWMKPDLQYPGKFYEDKAFIGTKNPNNYKGKVIALVNEITQSQAETLTMMLKQHPTCTVIGSNTSGANGNVVRLKMLNAETQYSGLGAFYPDGRETQRISIVPDIEVKPSVKGILDKRDEVLEKAISIIEGTNATALK
ncbi:S41 family peptidase [Soonwooa sp.]|uniref:S41 family peptidase n=1 Tax=Soonwooa sp. TaxID=1938592 RepID=UPI002636712A|nr:S41 family peptidase [Soonwooa sp.]